MIQHVPVRGDALTRGRMYGEQAAAKVRRSIDAYADIFGHYAHWDWPEVVEHATAFLPHIEGFDPRLVDEMRGIAEGADVPLEDVVAINVRTEVMFAAKARSAAAALPRPAECTSFCLLPPPSSDAPVLVGQNWDWMLHARDTVVVVEAERDDGPNYVTAVEAGLLAKVGLNAHGVAIATNALVSDGDLGEPGVPYHVLLRAMLDAATPSEALAILQRGRRSSSANYVIGHDSGAGAVVEAAPGDFSRLFVMPPDATGIAVHGNHFEHPHFDGVDVGLLLMPDSPFRTQRARAHLHDVAHRWAPEHALAMLADHAGEPTGICCHPSPRFHPLEQCVTVLSVVMRPSSRTMWLTHGSPCETEPIQIEYADLLAEPARFVPGHMSD